MTVLGQVKHRRRRRMQQDTVGVASKSDVSANTPRADE